MATSLKGHSTRWSIIRRSQGVGPKARCALNELLQRYQQYMLDAIRALRYPPGQSAEDLLQDFLLGFIQREDWMKLDETRGTFRGWLHQALRTHRSNCSDAWSAQRNPASKTVSSEAFEACHDENPERYLLRRYALTTLEQALSLVRAQQEQEANDFDTVADFIPRRYADRGEQKRVAAALGMTPGELGTRACRLRSSFKRALKSVVADTLDIDPDSEAGQAAIVQEIECLICAFERGPILPAPGGK